MLVGTRCVMEHTARISTRWVAQPMLGHKNTTQGLAASDSANVLYSGSSDGTMKIWNLDDLTCVATHKVDGAAYAFVELPDQTLFLGGWDAKVRRFDLQTGLCVQTLSGHTMPNGRTGHINALLTSLDQRHLFSAGADGTVGVWEIKSGERIRSLQVISSFTMSDVYALALSRDGKRLFAGGFDANVTIWDVCQGRSFGTCIGTLRGHEMWVSSIVATGEDGQLVYSSSADRTIRVWDVLSRRAIRVLRGHSGVVRSLFLSSDESTLYSASWDGTVRLWNTADGACLRALRTHISGFVNIVPSKDEHRFFTSCANGDLVCWTAVKPSVIAAATHVLHADLADIILQYVSVQELDPLWVPPAEETQSNRGRGGGRGRGRGRGAVRGRGISAVTMRLLGL